MKIAILAGIQAFPKLYTSATRIGEILVHLSSCLDTHGFLTEKL